MWQEAAEAQNLACFHGVHAWRYRGSKHDGTRARQRTCAPQEQAGGYGQRCASRLFVSSRWNPSCLPTGSVLACCFAHSGIFAGCACNVVRHSTRSMLVSQALKGASARLQALRLPAPELQDSGYDDLEEGGEGGASGWRREKLRSRGAKGLGVGGAE